MCCPQPDDKQVAPCNVKQSHCHAGMHMQCRHCVCDINPCHDHRPTHTCINKACHKPNQQYMLRYCIAPGAQARPPWKQLQQQQPPSMCNLLYTPNNKQAKPRARCSYIHTATSTHAMFQASRLLELPNLHTHAPACVLLMIHAYMQECVAGCERGQHPAT